MEVDLVTEPSVRTLKVGHELTAQLFLRVQGPWGQVHESRSGRAGQDHRKVVGHDILIFPCCKDGGGVDL
jgi:hypothetical protein